MAFFYNGFGLVIKSDVEIPELIKTGEAVPDLEVVSGNVFAMPFARMTMTDSCTGYGYKKYLKKSSFGFSVESGNKIIINRDIFADDGIDYSPMLESMFLFAWLQRGAVRLHASAVAFEGKALVFAGDGGTGKSTTAGVFRKAGCRFLGDDITVISETPEGYQVIPFALRNNLNSDMLDMMGDDRSSLKKMFGKEKYAFPVPPETTPVLLGKIYLLNPGDAESVSLTPVEGRDKVAAVLHYIQDYESYGRLLSKKEAFRILSAFAARAEIARLVRPVRDCGVFNLVEAIKNDFRGDPKTANR